MTYDPSNLMLVAPNPEARDLAEAVRIHAHALFTSGAEPEDLIDALTLTATMAALQLLDPVAVAERWRTLADSVERLSAATGGRFDA